MPIGRVAEGIGVQVVAKDLEHHVAVVIYDDVEAQVEPGALGETLPRGEQHSLSFGVRDAHPHRALAQHDPVRVVIRQTKHVGAVVHRIALAAHEEERREAGRSAAGAALNAPANRAALGHGREVHQVREERHRPLNCSQRVERIQKAPAARRWINPRRDPAIHRRDVQPIVKKCPVSFSHMILHFVARTSKISP